MKDARDHENGNFANPSVVVNQPVLVFARPSMAKKVVQDDSESDEDASETKQDSESGVEPPAKRQKRSAPSPDSASDYGDSGSDDDKSTSDSASVDSDDDLDSDDEKAKEIEKAPSADEASDDDGAEKSSDRGALTSRFCFLCTYFPFSVFCASRDVHRMFAPRTFAPRLEIEGSAGAIEKFKPDQVSQADLHRNCPRSEGLGQATLQVQVVWQSLFHGNERVKVRVPRSFI